jgi:hypothetical protein
MREEVKNKIKEKLKGNDCLIGLLDSNNIEEFIKEGLNVMGVDITRIVNESLIETS